MLMTMVAYHRNRDMRYSTHFHVTHVTNIDSRSLTIKAHCVGIFVKNEKHQQDNPELGNVG